MVRSKSQIIALGLGLAGLCGASAVATADGYQSRAAAYAPFSWTGLYLGVNGGYTFSGDQTVNVNETFLGGPFFNGNFGALSPTGGFGGAQAGANLQLGQVVLGVEVDAQWSNVTDGATGTITPYLSAGNSITVATSNAVRSFGTFRPRVGLAWDRTLVYATGGLAWGDVKHRLTMTDTFGFVAADTVSGIQVGYVLGGGLEHAFSNHLSLKVEYQYIDLGTTRYTSAETVGGVSSGFQLTTDTKTDFHTVRLGLNYKFGEEPRALK